MATALNASAWSTTPASNDGADSTIGTIANTSSPTVVDDWTKGVMAAVKKYVLDTDGGLTSSGTDTITISTNRNISAGHQAAGFSLRFKAGGTNTGAATLNVDGLGAVAIKRQNGDALSAGDIVSGGVYDVAFDGTNYKLMGANAGATGFGSLTGANTWSGANVFTGNVTVGDGSGDVVVIKGTTVNAFMSATLNSANAAAFVSAAGLGSGATTTVGTAATRNTGTSGTTVPLLDGANTWSESQTMQTSTGSVTPLMIDRSGAADSGVGLIRLNKGGVSTTDMIRFLAGGSLAGRIQTGSDSTSYLTSSDGRLKPEEHRSPITEPGALIDALSPVRFRWRDGGVDYGFIAQEVHAELPDVVVVGSPEGASPDDKNFTPWMLERGRFEPFLIAEVQSLRRRVAALERA